jgi:translation initiation factor 3 subunit C
VSSFFRTVSDSESDSSDEESELSDSGSDSGLEGKVQHKGKGRKLKVGDSDSDESSDEESDDDDEEKKAEGAPKPGSRFLRGDSSDSDSDDERTKVVKSAKSKRAEEVEASVKAIDNAGKINDWSAISNGEFLLVFFRSCAPLLTRAIAEFDKLARLVARQTNVAEAIPTGFIKLLVSLDDLLAGAQGAKKKMNATNAKALNSMKQKVKKSQREHEDAINKYKAVRPISLDSAIVSASSVESPAHLRIFHAPGP